MAIIQMNLLIGPGIGRFITKSLLNNEIYHKKEKE